MISGVLMKSSDSKFTLLFLIGHRYCKPELKELCRYSEKLSTSWARVALELNLSSETIDALEVNSVHTDDRCRRMFNTWLHRSLDPCWCEIVEALKMAKLSHLATEVEAKHLGM